MWGNDSACSWARGLIFIAVFCVVLVGLETE